MGGGGGSPQPSSTTVQNTNIPEYARPYVETMLGATQQQLFNTKQGAPTTTTNPDGTTTTTPGTTEITGVKPYVPYSENPADYVAGFSPLQQQAQQGVAGLQLPGEYGTAAGLTGMSTLGAMGAGRDYQRMATNPYAVGAYMNPYIQESLQPQLNEIARQGQIQAQQAAGQATAAGAFGGTRGALQQNEAARNALLAQQNAIGQGYNQAFNQAQQAMQYGAGLGLQGQQAAMQGAGQLANIGQMGLQGQQGILNLQNQFGTTQQQQQQNIINQAVQNYATAQQYPQQQLAFMNAMLRGLPLQTMTTQGYQAAPSTLSQLGGLAATGIGAYGALKKEGGVIKEKKFVNGGVAESVMADLQNMDDAHLLQQAKTSPSAIVRREAAQILAERQAAQGIEAAPSNLPTSYAAEGGIMQTGDSDDGYAGGGMVAFERGGIAALPVKRYNGVYPEGSFVYEDLYGGEPYGRTEGVQTPRGGTRTSSINVGKEPKPMSSKEVLENLERGKKAEAAAKTAKTAKDVVAAAEVAAPTGKAYTAGAKLGSVARSIPQAVAAGEVVGNLGSYKFQEPGLDTSVGGVYKAAKEGNYGQAFRNLYMGLPEAGMDLMRGAGSVADIFLPGTPVTDAIDARLKKQWGVTTPSDRAAAPAADGAKDNKGGNGAPPAAPAAKKDDGLGVDEEGIAAALSGKGGPGGIDAAFGNTPLGRLRAAAYKNVQEADLKQSKAQADLDKQREDIESRKGQKLYQALMMGGAEAMAGTSPYALQNIGRGIAGGVKDYAEAEKAERAEKKLLLQYQTALDQADYAKKMGNFTALEQIQGRLDALKIAAMNANATKQASLDAAYKTSFGQLVAKFMYQNGMTEDQAIAAANRVYAAGDKSLPQGATVTRVTPAKS